MLNLKVLAPLVLLLTAGTAAAEPTIFLKDESIGWIRRSHGISELNARILDDHGAEMAGARVHFDLLPCTSTECLTEDQLGAFENGLKTIEVQTNRFGWASGIYFSGEQVGRLTVRVRTTAPTGLEISKSIDVSVRNGASDSNTTKRLELLSAGSLVTAPGQDHGSSLLVRVTDLAGQPLAGERVIFELSSGDYCFPSTPLDIDPCDVGRADVGTFANGEHYEYVVTDANGHAAAPAWTAPGTQGLSRIEAHVTGDSWDGLYVHRSILTRMPVNVGLSGAWANPENPSQGFSFDLLPERDFMFAAWFTYESTEGQNAALTADIGAPWQRWLSAGGTYSDLRSSLHGQASETTLGLYSSTGGVFNDPRATQTTRVGTLRVVFENCSSATVHYQFDSGRSGTIPLTRYANEGMSQVCKTLSTP